METTTPNHNTEMRVLKNKIREIDEELKELMRKLHKLSEQKIEYQKQLLNLRNEIR